MPAPKTPVAKPRRSARYQALTKGMPTANVVPAMPRKNPNRSISGNESIDPAHATSSTNGTRREGQHREHQAAAVAVGQRADRDAAERPDEHGGGHEQGLLGAGQPHRLGVAHAERADDVPRPERHGEGEGREREVLRLRRQVDVGPGTRAAPPPLAACASSVTAAPSALFSPSSCPMSAPWQPPARPASGAEAESPAAGVSARGSVRWTGDHRRRVPRLLRHAPSTATPRSSASSVTTS